MNLELRVKEGQSFNEASDTTASVAVSLHDTAAEVPAWGAWERTGGGERGQTEETGRAVQHLVPGKHSIMSNTQLFVHGFTFHKLDWFRMLTHIVSGSYSWCHAMVLDIFGGRLDTPPVEGSRQRVPRSLLLLQPGGWQQAPAHWRTAPTPPLPLGRQPPLLVPGARQRAFRPTCSSIAPAPPPRAATGGLRFFLLPDLLSTAIPLSSEGSLTACPSFLPGFGTNVTKLVDMGRRRREPANI